MKHLKHILFSAIMLAVGLTAWSQETITGTVNDMQNMPMPGANITIVGTAEGTVTDAAGAFSLSTDRLTGELQISFMGYEAKIIPFTVTQGQTLNVGTIILAEGRAEEMETVVVVGRGVIDLEEDRKTPVAVSTITAKQIREKAGNQEFSEVMKNTPSVYVASQAGGYGDSKMYVRGFDQTNTAFLLNGQPINGMEDGNMYWSNWSGMTDVANAVQVQRGLGSSKLAISSVGGTVNIVTRATEMREGGFAQSIIGNDDYIKNTVAYSTGMSQSGWGFSAMLTRWSGDGYNRGTFGEGHNYFVSVGYKANDRHHFNFLLFGAPQWHDQNFSKAISLYLEHGRKYNNNYGSYEGDYLSERRNYYHKPVANFNWDFTIDATKELSTVLYASWGRGGGTGNWGNARVRKESGHIDFDAIRENNMALAGGIGNTGDAYAIRNSVNNHAWYGIVSNFNHKITENLSYNVGVDLRTYKGTHYREISHFLGLNGFEVDNNAQYPDGYIVTEQFSANPWSAFTNDPADNQKVNYDYDERISYGGLFGQVEYATDLFSAYVQGAISNQSHIRWDRFQYVEAEEESEKVNNTGYNIKGGINFNLSEQHSVFANAGFYSRQPYHDNIYLSFGNDVNPFAENEKITGFEAGYRFKSQYFSANLDFYRTTWNNRVTTTEGNDDDGNEVFFINSGVSQMHTGAEFEFMAHPFPFLDVRGFASAGNWEYDDDIYRRTVNQDRETIEESVDDIDGGKVGNAAQTTFGIGVVGKITSRLSIDADWRKYDDLYTGFVDKNTVQLPGYDLIDAGITYRMNFTKTSLTFRLNVNNVFDNVYISEMTSNVQTTDLVDADDPAAGTYASNGLVYDGLATANNVFFGNGRTWNFGMRFNF